MISGKQIARRMAQCFLLLALCVSPLARSAGNGVPFSVGGGTENIVDLKQRAVMEFLQRHLGNRFGQYESQVTPDFAERYIMDYKVSRAAGNRMQLSGHLDADALKGWARLAENRRGGTTMKPMLILSSVMPGLTLAPSATQARVKDSTMAQLILAEATPAFQKFNARLGTGGSSIALGQPPRTDSELKTLRDYGIGEGFSSVLWVHLLPCKSCGGTRMDVFLYNLTSGRQVVARSEDLALSGGDFASAARLKAALKAPFLALKTELDQMVSAGTLFSSAYRLTVEGLESYRAFKKVETELADLDFIVESVLKRSEPKSAEFEILSSLPGDELMSRLDNENFNGFKLKAVRVDSRNLVVRYSK